MSTDPEVSVVVPAFNRKALTARAVGSLLRQEFDAPFEVVVVDDGSTDGTAEAVGGMGGRVRVVAQPNRGAAGARHAGIEASRAPIVAFLDSDDVAPPNKLADLLRALRAHPDCVASFGVVRGPGAPRGDADRWTTGPLDGRTAVVADPFAELLGVAAPIVGAMNLMAHRAPALEASRGRGFYRAANDYDLQLRLARHGRFAFVAAVTCEYEAQPDGLTATSGAARQAAFALCSAAEALRESGRRESLRGLMRARVEADWPAVAVEMALRRDWAMLGRVLAIAARHARWRRAPRGIWWALDRLVEERPSGVPGGIARSVRWGRSLRSLRGARGRRDSGGVSP